MLKEYIDLIKDNQLRKLCNSIISISEEQLRQPSSSSGMYHPKDEICEYGQVIHIKKTAILILWAARRNADRMDTDLLITSALLHDLPKKFIFDSEILEKQDFIHSSKSKMNKNHGYDNAIYIDSIAKNLNIDPEKRKILFDAISGHMGKWTPVEYQDRGWNDGHRIHTSYGEYLQEADYFSTRKNVLVDYNIELAKCLINELCN